MTAGRNSFVSELVALAGGRNMGDDLACNYGAVSPEWVLTRNPDVILCLYPGADHHARKTVLSRLGWRSLRAALNNRVYDEFSLDTILRPGPRVLDGVEQLRRAIADNNQSSPSPANFVTQTMNGRADERSDSPTGQQFLHAPPSTQGVRQPATQ